MASSLYLIDGSAQIHRAYFAIQGLATSRGLPTNAVYGFATMLRKLLADYDPPLLGISFDLPGPTFRHQEYAAYKSHRPKMAEDLSLQLPYVHRLCEGLRIPVIEIPGFEADDVLATLAQKAVDQGLKVVLVSADKDLLQLVSENVSVLNPGREGSGATLFDAKKVEEKMGVAPSRVVDLLALMGDAVDNVPGVAGIGEKGARELVKEFGSVEGALENADRVKRATYREGLKNHKDEALLSKRLVTLRRDVPITLDLGALARTPPDQKAVHALFMELEFASLAKEYATEVAPSRTVNRVAQEGDIPNLVKDARERGLLAIAPWVSSPEVMRGRLLGLVLCARPGESVHVPLERTKDESLKALLADSGVKKLAVEGKRAQIALEREGMSFGGLSFDALVAAYLLNPGRRNYTLEELSYEFLGERASPVEMAAPGGALGAEELRLGNETETLLRLHAPALQRLGEEGLASVYEKMELPLIPVLARMEQVGVLVDAPHLQAMSRDMEKELLILTDEILSLAGTEFNINSPVQLREILFERLGLKAGKKTAKTRAASTAEDVLEELAHVHPLPKKILEYRAIQKLKSTYVDALPGLILPETGRIHATFHQTIAATGRISSSDPNLQNIPIRTGEGRRIREAFVAQKGNLLLSADYSQVELRVLAHLSKDETLIETFRRGEDIHERTAREVFGPFSSLSQDEQRRTAKMINYALLYGKTAFSLAKDIGTSKKEAEDFIQAYFARYPRVRRFLDETLDHARKTGVVRTLFGRLRRLPDLHAKNFPVRMEAERQAINTPVQGSAADLIKKAMIDVDTALRERALKSRLILQIHDELLLEVSQTEAEEVRDLVKVLMEKALPLEVPLVVDARLGPNWAAVH